MRDFSKSCHLPVPIDRAWQAVCDPNVLQTIAWPVFGIVPFDPPAFPERWEARDYRVRVRLFGVIPLGWQIIGPRFPKTDPSEHTLVDIGRSTLFRHWVHRLTLTLVDGGTRLTDELRYDAGPLTWPAGLVLRLFFAHRHRRLRALLHKEA